MTMLERVKAMPLPEPDNPESTDGCTYACPEGWSADQLRADREQIAKEADERIERLCVALEGLMHEAHSASKPLHMDSEWSRIARARLAEARKP